ncbi:MAG: hypothetical protein WDN00_07110 [Limisphaerales bacterium]
MLVLAAMAFYVLQRAIISEQGDNSLLAEALGRDWKGKLSPALYLAAIPLAFLSPWIAISLYVFVALMWFIPDRRIERVLTDKEKI